MIDVVSLILAKRRGELSREERIRRLRESILLTQPRPRSSLQL